MLFVDVEPYRLNSAETIGTAGYVAIVTMISSGSPQYSLNALDLVYILLYHQNYSLITTNTRCRDSPDSCVYNIMFYRVLMVVNYCKIATTMHELLK